MKTEHAPLNAPLQDALKALGWQDRVLLAPMSGVTDRPFRDYIRNLGQQLSKLFKAASNSSE